MKKVLSLILAFVFAVGICASAPITITANAASVDDLSFELNEDGQSYSLVKCNQFASGKVVIPDYYNDLPVTRIGPNCFAHCSSLSNIEIPNSVTTIEYFAFYGCTALATLYLPENIKSLDNLAFSGCTNLTEINVSNINKYYKSLAGVLFDKNVTVLLHFPIGKKTSSYTIPNGVINIGKSAFRSCTSLEVVIIPNSVVDIGYNAFSGCVSLKTISIPDSVVSMGDGVFSGCTSLESVEIGNGLQKMGTLVFYGCDSLENIVFPLGLATTLKPAAFEGSAFYNNEKNWSDGGFYVADHLIEVKKESQGVFKIKEGTQYIGSYAFQDCVLTSVVIPNSLSVIEDEAFYNATIEKIEISDIGKWCEIDFKGLNANPLMKGAVLCSDNTEVTDVIVPNGVTKISDFAFMNADSVSSIIVANTVTSIGEYSFSYCDSLESIVLPKGITSIGDNAFYNSSYYNNENNWNDGELYIGNHLIRGAFSPYSFNDEYVFNVNVNCVAGGAFYECPFKLITLPRGVSKINEHTFVKCNNLETVVIPNTVKSIASFAFFNCEKLKSITIPSSVVEIEENAFGYYDNGWDEICKYSNLVIYGEYGSAAEKYAKENDIKFINISTHEHCYIEKTIKQANCLEKGMNRYVCSCGDYYTEENIPAKGHDFENIEYSPYPTCEKTGVMWGWCNNCDSMVSETVPAFGHDFSDSVIDEYPTCNESGKQSEHCKYCDAKRNIEVVPAKGHTEVTVTGKAATCTATGLTDGKKCSVCGTVTKAQQTIKATGHKEVVIPAVAPTFTTVGKTEGKKCSVCGTITVAQKDVAKLTLSTPTVTQKNTAKGIQVNWNKIDGAESYVVYRSVYSGGKWSKWASIKKGVTGTSYVDGTVKLGTSYKYTVRAVNGSVMSGYQNTKDGLKYNVTPTVKVALASNGIKVSWSTAANATGYTVYSSTYNTKTKKWSSWTNRGTVKANKTSWTDTKVTSGVQYKYTVRAINGKVASTYVASNTLLYLAQPTTSVKAVSNGINVAWTQSTGATGYTVYRMEYNAKTKKWSGWKKMGTAKASKKSWTDKSAKKGVQYKYTVKAVNGNSASTYKSSGSVKR